MGAIGFQLPHPMRGATGPGRYGGRGAAISTHAPTQGATVTEREGL